MRGGAPFTKDAVYLTGVLEVDAFLRIAIRDNRPELEIKTVDLDQIVRFEHERLARAPR